MFYAMLFAKNYVGTTLACLCVTARRQVVVHCLGQGQDLSLQFGLTALVRS